MSTPAPASLSSSAKAALSIGALGVVFGDIGTSPLYTLKEAFGPHYGIDASRKPPWPPSSSTSPATAWWNWAPRW